MSLPLTLQMLMGVVVLHFPVVAIMGNQGAGLVAEANVFRIYRAVQVFALSESFALKKTNALLSVA